MARTLRVLSVFGTRPEAIKMAPLVKALARRADMECLICVSAQHRKMLDSVMELFRLKADFDLDVMKPGQTPSEVNARILRGLERVLQEARPDLTLVHGDTTTSLSAALAAFYAKCPVGHVEAGLRTHDRYSPFPEEMNRTLIGQIAKLHFCPTAQNADNLRREGVSDGIFVTGNTVIDAMRYTVGDGALDIPALRGLDMSRRIITMTCHRRENYGVPMKNIFSAVRKLAEDFDDLEIVYPVHPAPAVREAAEADLGNARRIHLIEPLDAMEMHRLMSMSHIILTDSGGIQEEAPALGKPVLVLRRETERPEAASAGTVRLAGTQTEEIYSLARELLTSREKYEQMARAVNPYGDGRACPRIADAIAYSFGLSDAPPDIFSPA